MKGRVPLPKKNVKPPARDPYDIPIIGVPKTSAKDSARLMDFLGDYFDKRLAKEKYGDTFTLSKQFLAKQRVPYAGSVKSTQGKQPKSTTLRTVADREARRQKLMELYERPNFTEYPMKLVNNENLKNGMVGMGERFTVDTVDMDRIKALDEANLIKIYNETPSIFDVVFDYEGTHSDEVSTYWADYEKTEDIRNFLDMYERRFGAL